MKRATRTRREANVAGLKARAAKSVMKADPTRSAPRAKSAGRAHDRRKARDGRTNVAGTDRETRDRLIDVAAVLFAQQGFDTVTVRDICARASANVAAVNYHFGGKAGLYDEVLRSAIRIMQDTTEEIRRTGENQPPEARLEASIRVFLTRVATTPNTWIHQLMLREVNNPTPSFNLILNEVLKPRAAYVRHAVADIMQCQPDDPRVAMCVMSVQSQLFAIVNNPLASRFDAPPLTPDRADALARHIACFSIAGVRGIASR